MADPGFYRIPLPSIGRLLIRQDSSIKSHGRTLSLLFTQYLLFTRGGGCRSPRGNLVLTKLTRSIKVWTEVSPSLHSSLCPPTFHAFRTACVAKLSTDIALCSLSAGCQAAKVSLRGSRKDTLLELSHTPAFMSVEGGDVTKLVNQLPLLIFFSLLVLNFLSGPNWQGARLISL